MEKKEINHYLVIEDTNWADEMDIQGFQLVKSKKDVKNLKEEILDKIEASGGEDSDVYPLTTYIGSNQELECESRSELSRTIKVKPITPEEYNSIKKVFGTTSFGNFGFLD